MKSSNFLLSRQYARARKGLGSIDANAPSLSFILGLGIICFLFLVVSVTAVVFSLGGHVQLRWLVLAILLTLLFIAYLTRSYGVITRVGTALVLTILVGTSIWASSISIDSSYDGNSYHKIAIGALKNGWNPVSGSVNDFNRSPKNLHPVIDVTGIDRANDYLWADTYPKATWMFAANIYNLTGNIESGKAVNILLLMAVILMTFGYLRKRFDTRKSLFVALLLAFNPVAISQIAGYFNDGALGNALLLLILLLTVLCDRRADSMTERHILYAMIGMILVFTINIKFTGLAYAGIISLCYLAFLVFGKSWREAINLTITGLVALVFGLCVVGASSYISNAYTYHHPLFPIFGEDKRDIMTHNQPASFANKSGMRKFVEANLSYTGNILREASLTKGEPKVKIPFTIAPEELVELGSSPDLRQGGYGVWFSGVLLITIVTGAYLLFRYTRLHKLEASLLLIPTISVLITVVAFDTSWWARYMPHLYIIPLLVLLSLWATKHLMIAKILAFAILFNIVLLVSQVAIYQYRYTNAYSHNLSVNMMCGESPILVQGQGSLSGAMYNLWDRCENIKLLKGPPVDLSDQAHAIPLLTDIYRIIR